MLTGHLLVSLGPVTVQTRHPAPGAICVAAATSARWAGGYPVSRWPRWRTVHHCRQNKYLDVVVGVGVRACVRDGVPSVGVGVRACVRDGLPSVGVDVRACVRDGVISVGLVVRACV